MRTPTPDGLRIFYSHAYRYDKGVTAARAILRAAWGRLYIRMEPSKRHPLHMDEHELLAELKRRITSSDVVLVSGRPFDPRRRHIILHELDVAFSEHIPILVVTAAADEIGAPWVCRYMTDWCDLDDLLSRTLAVLPPRRRAEFCAQLQKRKVSRSDLRALAQVSRSPAPSSR